VLLHFVSRERLCMCVHSLQEISPTRTGLTYTEKRNNILHLCEIEAKFFNCPARNLVFVLNELVFKWNNSNMQIR